MGMVICSARENRGSHHAKSERTAAVSAAVAKFLETAAEFDRQAAEAKRPLQKRHCANMAKVYRCLAQPQAIVDDQLGTPPNRRRLER
jgi:hypothetical protein